jgi:hypothetical protein
MVPVRTGFVHSRAGHNASAFRRASAVPKVARLRRSLASLTRLVEAGLDVWLRDLAEIEARLGGSCCSRLCRRRAGGRHDFDTDAVRAYGGVSSWQTRRSAPMPWYALHLPRSCDGCIGPATTRRRKGRRQSVIHHRHERRDVSGHPSPLSLSSDDLTDMCGGLELHGHHRTSLNMIGST